MKRILGTITIFTSDRQASSAEMNRLLTENGHLIMSRLGVNVQKHCAAHCPGLIVLAVEGEDEKIFSLEEKLRDLPELEVKIAVMSEQE
ncbi:MAG: hypothetical protein NTX66_03125, partial [Candidatus Falkowbacteria bacterium]|nr:hypothetical protein [Candidatus Falkowbacteria bacterium]